MATGAPAAPRVVEVVEAAVVAEVVVAEKVARAVDGLDAGHNRRSR